MYCSNTILHRVILYTYYYNVYHSATIYKLTSSNSIII